MDRRTGSPPLDWRTLTLACIAAFLPLSAQETSLTENPSPLMEDPESGEGLPDGEDLVPAETLPDNVLLPPADSTGSGADTDDLVNLSESLAVIGDAIEKLTGEQEEIRKQIAELAQAQSPDSEQGPDPVEVAVEELRTDLAAISRQLADDQVPAPALEPEPDPFTDKIYILTILVLVLVAAGILLQFLSGKRAASPRSAASPHREDFKNLHARLDNQKTQLDTIATNLEPLKESPPPPLTREDFESPLRQAIAPLLSRLDALEPPAAPTLSLEPVERRLQAQEDALASIQSSLAELAVDRQANAEEERRSESLQAELNRLKEEFEHRESEWSTRADQADREAAALRDSLEAVRHVLPAWLQDENLPESFSTDLQAAAISSRSPHALEFLGAALTLEGLLRQPEPSRKVVAQGLSQVSQAAYRYLLDDLHAEKDVVRKAMRSWIANLTELLSSRSVSLRISQVFPGDGFHLDTMEAVDSVSGNRLNVDQPFSWLIEDTSQSPPRVLIRAKVITA